MTSAPVTETLFGEEPAVPRPLRQRRPRNEGRPRLTLGRGLAYLAVFSVVIAYVFPLIFLLNTALKSPDDFASDPVGITPTLAFSNFIEAWETANLGAYLGNSVLYMIVSSVISTVGSLLIAFPVSRGYIRFSKFWNVVFVLALFLPNALTTQFQLMLSLGLYNSQIGYILLMSGSLGVGPLIIVGYLRSLPRELDESAALDGCGYFRYLWTFVIPLARPVLVTVFILHAISVWNDIIIATIYLAEPAKYPMTLGLFAFYGTYGNQWALLSAATLIVAAPLVVVFILLQRYIVAGATSGAVKS